MADKVAGLIFRIAADTQALQAGMKQAQTTTQKMKASMKALGVAMLATFSVRMVTNFVKASVEAYNIQAQAEVKLLTALKGRSDIQERLMRQASQLQKVTIFGDEATIEAQALLASLGLTEKQITMLIPKVQDMATGLGMDLVGAASLVGKTVTTTTDALARYFDTGLKGVSNQSERAAVLTQALTDKFDGQAEAAAKAGTGPLTQLKNVLGDIKEELGKAALESTHFQENVSGLATTLSEIDWAKTISSVGQVAKAIGMASIQAQAFILLLRGVKDVLPKKQIKTPVGIGKPAKIGGGALPQTPNIGVVSSGHLLGDFTTGGPLAGMEGIGAQLLSIVEPANKLKETVDTVIKPAMIDLGIVVQQTMMSVADSFGAGIESVFAGTANLENGFSGILKAFGQFAVQMGKLILAYGLSMISFKKAFANPAAAIVAGAALIAIGSAISGLASRGVSGGGGYGMATRGYAVANMTGGQKMNVEVTGVLKGSDIYLSQSNYMRGKVRM